MRPLLLTATLLALPLPLPLTHAPAAPTTPAEQSFCAPQQTAHTTFDLCTSTDGNALRVWIARPACTAAPGPCRITGLWTLHPTSERTQVYASLGRAEAQRYPGPGTYDIEAQVDIETGHGHHTQHQLTQGMRYTRPDSGPRLTLTTDHRGSTLALTVRNSGPAAARDVRLTIDNDRYGQGATPTPERVTTDPHCPRANKALATCSLGTIAPGGSVTVPLRADLAEAAKVRLTGANSVGNLSRQL
ncbi:hypothetical protein ACIO3O_06015 [Streptomyces sp. NPDC087440]|uniref:hypothetical protein n=1 Tax=Streptomyces sp. NPDC087440 TaxID=3365790 RepID=UPI003829404E